MKYKMNVSSLLIGLMLVFCAISPTAGKSKYDHLEELCRNLLTCNCHDIVDGYEFECPAFVRNFVIKIFPEKHVRIDCFDVNDNSYMELPSVYIGDIPSVNLQQCPLPNKKNSIKLILKRLGITNVRSLQFSYDKKGGIVVMRHHLQSFKGLETLEINNRLSKLSDDLFDDLGNLTRLDIRSTRVNLPLNIFRNLKNLDFLELGNNNLSFLKPGIFKNQHKLTVLSLWGNNLHHLTKDNFIGADSISSLDISSNYIETLEPDLFSNLLNLTAINLSGNEFRELPPNLFSKNRNLTEIRMVENFISLDTLPNLFLSGFPLLADVHIKCGLTHLPDDLFKDSLNLKNVAFSKNLLTTLPSKLFSNQLNLSELDLSGNRLSDLDNGVFADLQSLSILDLSSNELTAISENIFVGLHSIEDLYLNDNFLKTIHPSAFSATAHLVDIQIRNNQLSFVSYDGEEKNSNLATTFRHLKELESIDLRNNSLTYLNFSDFQFKSEDLTIDLRYNLITRVHFDDYVKDARPSENILELFLNFNPFNCDCSVCDFLEYLKLNRSTIIVADQLKCSSPKSMLEKYVTSLISKDITCSLATFSSVNSTDYCPIQCECIVHPYNRVMLANCSNANMILPPKISDVRRLNLTFTELYLDNNNLIELPDLSEDQFASITIIRAKNNRIQMLSPNNLPSNLTTLDLSYNQISSLNNSVIEILNTTIYLNNIFMGNNRWKCDCSAQQLLSFARLKFRKIKDISEWKCLDGQRFPKLMRRHDLCAYDETDVIIFCITFTSLILCIVVISVVYYIYHKKIIVWMYSNGCCIWKMCEEESEKNKRFDAFISFSSDDSGFVMENIVRAMENGTPRYQLCLYERDWVAGEYLIESICRSVEESRRTIVILTPNFLRSVWCRIEFEAAHRFSVENGLSNLIVILHGNIGDIQDLDPCIRLYLKTHNFITWGEQWFWRKLRRAMHSSEFNEMFDEHNNGNV